MDVGAFVIGLGQISSFFSSDNAFHRMPELLSVYGVEISLYSTPSCALSYQCPRIVINLPIFGRIAKQLQLID